MTSSTAQPESGARQDDAVTLEAVMPAAYEAISAPPGGKRDLDRFAALFRPDARLYSVSRADGDVQVVALTLEDFVNGFSGPIADGVHEREVFQRIERFGDIAHIWSTYEIRASAEDSEVRGLGINSVQLIWKDGRWWIVSAMFENAGPELSMPDEYRGPSDLAEPR